MKIRNVLLAAAVVFQTAAVFAQPRKSYPVPVKTPEVQRLLEQRRLWTPSAREALPQSVDNSVSEHFPAIFSQIGGSCAQSSGIRYMFTYEMNRCLGRKATAPDNVFSYFYTWNFLNNGMDEGGWSEQGLNIARSTGVMNLADFPDQTSAYQFRWQSGYDKYIRAMHYRVDEILSMPVTSEAEIEVVKSYLAQGGVVTYSSYSSDWKMNDYYDGPSQTGYRSLLTRLATTGAHAMTIAGYDDTVEFTPEGGEPTTGAFIVVNSWGSYSHDNGRFYLPYYFFLQKYADGNMLSDDVTGITVKYHEPKIIFKVGLTYTSRNDLAFRARRGEQTLCGDSDGEGLHHHGQQSGRRQQHAGRLRVGRHGDCLRLHGLPFAGRGHVRTQVFSDRDPFESRQDARQRTRDVFFGA
ncbi:MAG: C1 family peptidase [Alistipes putredinis]|nr:MAG: C1 family peptidase [Alistipes putredinis]